MFTLSLWNLARVLNPMSWKSALKLKLSLFCNFLWCPCWSHAFRMQLVSCVLSQQLLLCVGSFGCFSGVGALSFLIRPSLSLSTLRFDHTLGIGLVIRRAGSDRFYPRFVSWGGESPASSVSKGAGPALHWERQAISASSEGSGNLKI